MMVDPNCGYAELMGAFHNNLCRLHKALPGEAKTKTAKIYWTNSVADVLFPYFFLNSRVDIDSLQFALIPGEANFSSPFQAKDINFKHQLQFIGRGREKIVDQQKKYIVNLSQEIFGENIFEDMEMHLLKEDSLENDLMYKAYVFTTLNHIQHTLQKMKLEGNTIRLSAKLPQEREEFIKQLISWQ